MNDVELLAQYKEELGNTLLEKERQEDEHARSFLNGKILTLEQAIRDLSQLTTKKEIIIAKPTPEETGLILMETSVFDIHEYWVIETKISEDPLNKEGIDRNCVVKWMDAAVAIGYIFSNYMMD